MSFVDFFLKFFGSIYLVMAMISCNLEIIFDLFEINDMTGHTSCAMPALSSMSRFRFFVFFVIII